MHADKVTQQVRQRRPVTATVQQLAMVAAMGAAVPARRKYARTVRHV